MTETKWKIGKTYTTRDGRNAIIYAIHPEQDYCIHGAVSPQREHSSRKADPHDFSDKTAWQGRGWFIETWAKNGCNNTKRNVNPLDLMPPEPETHVAWANIHTYSSLLCLHETREESEDSATDGRTACIRIEWKDGQFDD